MINLEYIKQFGPCSSGLNNYIKHYENWSGTWSEFFELEHIPIDDKMWLFFRENKDIEKEQFEFALHCADRAVSTAPKKTQDFFNLVCIMRVSEDFGSIEHLKDDEYSAAYSAAYWTAGSAADQAAYWASYSAADWAADQAADWAADWAADSAADQAAEREIQLEIAKYVMEGK